MDIVRRMLRERMHNFGANLNCGLHNRVQHLLTSYSRFYSSRGHVRCIPKEARQSKPLPVINNSETKISNSFTSNPLDVGVRKATDSLSHRGLQFLNLSEQREQSKSLQCDDMNSGLGIPPSSRCTSEHEEKNQDRHVDYKMVGELLDSTAEDESTEIEGRRQIEKSRNGAENFAIRLLRKRAISVSELRRKLQTKKFPSDIIEDVINDFCYRGLVNDKLYAENYSRSRWLSSTWGPGRIKKGLLTKGISRGDAEKAITLLFEERNGSVEEPLELGISKDSMDRLLVQATKRYVRCQGLAAETRRSRMVQWLVYRGFKWDVVTYVMKHLEGISINT